MAANVFQKSECGECQAMSAGWWKWTHVTERAAISISYYINQQTRK